MRRVKDDVTLWSLLGRETIGPPECPLLDRLTVVKHRRIGGLLLHRFYPNADDRNVHDHPWWFMTLVLRGGYDDMKQCRQCEGSGRFYDEVDFYACPRCKGEGVIMRERMRAGMLRFRPALHAHRTQVSSSGCVTLVLTGPTVREWGFYLGSSWQQWRSYIRQHGEAHRCDEEFV